MFMEKSSGERNGKSPDDALSRTPGLTPVPALLSLETPMAERRRPDLAIPLLTPRKVQL